MAKNLSPVDSFNIKPKVQAFGAEIGNILRDEAREKAGISD
jgi:hypothetical protein